MFQVIEAKERALVWRPSLNPILSHGVRPLFNLVEERSLSISPISSTPQDVRREKSKNKTGLVCLLQAVY